MAKKKKSADTPEAIVTRDSKEVGVIVTSTAWQKNHFPIGCTWRWNLVFNELMLEVLKEGEVIYQARVDFVSSVSGQTTTQPMWHTVEYPASNG